ncbi:tyrosine-type recombinase/integrase [Vibrio parahaemolyticus]|uniref:tyrosine-type recombinase/integrase n=1 Tax=Vibrio parahaemolyticus TaxID=670 RepID=UPI001EB79006|nr:tyrosine-type recombinase/integrase [Vibrio parahaemolyticus]
MYLLKHPSGVFYTRIIFPSSLRSLGYPNERRVSLQTKNRPLAIVRNLEMTSHLKRLFIDLAQDESFDIALCSTAIESIIETLRSGYETPDDDRSNGLPISQITQPVFNTPQHAVGFHSAKNEYYDFRGWLREFIQTKTHENVTALTAHQLTTRISHFLNYLDSNLIDCPDSGSMLAYIDFLRTEGRSAKTNKDYFAATKQFLTWIHAKNYLEKNPAQSLKPSFKKTKHVSEERHRWSVAELKRFFHSPEFLGQTDDFKWITYLQLFMGMRTQEPCQLYISNVHLEDAIPFISISDRYQLQHLKNQQAVRPVPIHPYLLECGFAEFVESRSSNTDKPLFNYTPQGKDHDWSKLYRTQFGRLQTKLGMKPKARPTAYSLRHTFIDELKMKDVPEHLVADIVGHSNPNMTFGRYGKKAQLSKMLETLNKLTLEEVL